MPLRSDGHHRRTFRAKAHAGQVEHQVGLPVRREDEPRDSRRKQQRDRVPHESPAAGCATGRFGQVARASLDAGSPRRIYADCEASGKSATRVSGAAGSTPRARIVAITELKSAAACTFAIGLASRLTARPLTISGTSCGNARRRQRISWPAILPEMPRSNSSTTSAALVRFATRRRFPAPARRRRASGS